MEFISKLTEATFLKRHGAHMIEVGLSVQDKRLIYTTLRFPIPGVEVLGSRVWFSSDLAKKKNLHHWEMVEVDNGDKIVVNSVYARHLAVDAVKTGLLGQAYSEVTVDVYLPGTTTKVDFMVKQGNKYHFYWVQPVFWGDEIHRGFYPHSPLTSMKLLRDIFKAQTQGTDVEIVFVSLHGGVQRLILADHIDPVWGQWLRQAQQQGVGLHALGSQVNESGILLGESLPIVIPSRSSIVQK